MERLVYTLSALRKRRVFRAAAAHVIAFWLLIQIADVVLSYVAPLDNAVRWILVCGVAMFPVTVLAAWLTEQPWRQCATPMLVAEIGAMVMVVVIAAMWTVNNVPQVSESIPTVAILPFSSSDTTTDRAISHALVQEIGSLLMKSRSIDVIAQESSASAYLEGLDVPSTASELDAGFLILGDVRTAGDLMELKIRLVDAFGEPLWSESGTRNLAELFDVQEHVASMVQQTLVDVGSARLVSDVAANYCPMPVDPEALLNFYTARYYVELRGFNDEAPQKLSDAISIYQQLIDAYPEFAEAYTGLGMAYAYQWTYDRENAKSDWQTAAAELASRALEYCPTLGEAIYLLPDDGEERNFWVWQYRTLSQMIDLEPQKTEYLQRLARHYLSTGLHERSVATAERNYALNPLSVRSIRELAFSYFQTGRIEESAELFDRAIELGSRTPNEARRFLQEKQCGDDIDCRIATFYAPFSEAANQLRVVYRQPANEDEARESILTAMNILDSDPDNWMNWLNDAACEFDHLIPLFFELLDYSRRSGIYWHWPNVWDVRCDNVWAAPGFADAVREAGFVNYWRVAGWPAMCREEGDEVICGDPARQASR
jgi:TolB-like protein